MSDMSWAKFKQEQQGQQREWSELGDENTEVQNNKKTETWAGGATQKN